MALFGDLVGAYNEALSKIQKGEAHVVHVGYYENRIVIVAHEDKKTKEVKVVDLAEVEKHVKGSEDCTDLVVPVPSDAEVEKEIAEKEAKKDVTCQYCGRQFETPRGRKRHESSCNGGQE